MYKYFVTGPPGPVGHQRNGPGSRMRGDDQHRQRQFKTHSLIDCHGANASDKVDVVGIGARQPLRSTGGLGRRSRGLASRSASSRERCSCTRDANAFPTVHPRRRTALHPNSQKTPIKTLCGEKGRKRCIIAPRPLLVHKKSNYVDLPGPDCVAGML